ncbi:MAG TPA: POTRA domain-containing protein [Acidobacteriaceae bacterium]|jgi:outer membrane protein insertion porin family|nr:POTRA domain-containing protein [Acidobacteriaceae bacterium]
MRLQSCLALVLLAWTIPASAEQSYKAAAIVFKNAGLYSQAQLEDIAQIHPGTPFTATDLGNAAQHLIDTGFFEDVGATLGSGGVESATVIFTTKPIAISDMIHLGFENFVWLSHDEIFAALHKRAPLFNGYIPESSPLVAEFDTALETALAAKGITAKVTHETFEPTMLRPERVLEYRIASPRVRVANVKLGGVSTALVPLLQKSVNAASTFGFNDGLAGQSTADAILAPLLNAGYAKASLSNVSLDKTITPDGASIVVNATLSAGDVCHVSILNFSGAPLYSAAEFAKNAKLQPGDIASREMLLETLAPLDSAYRREGYMDVVLKTDPSFDEAAHTVTYTISVIPGAQYRIREVTANNLDPAGLADFNKAFRMSKGELYNPEYVRSFLKNNSSIKSLEPYVATYKAYADPNTHTVDLILAFVRR